MIDKKTKERIKQRIEGTYVPPKPEKIAVVYELTEKQYKKYRRWRNAKKKKDGELYVGAIGGAYTFCFTPTGVGIVISVKAADGDVLNLTDFDTW